MGACFGPPADPRDNEVQKDLDKEQKLISREIKLLLLGAGGSGKSTLFKQLQYIHGSGFTNRQRSLFQKQIHEQLMESMKTLIIRCEDSYEDDPELNAKYKLYDYALDDEADDDETDADSVRFATQTVLKHRNGQRLVANSAVVRCLQRLWANDVIQRMFDIRNEICVPDSTQYFFDHLDRVTAEDYVPNDTDLLMVRYRTTGMQEKTFDIKGHKFTICDVGGQRNERRKWIHFFSNVTSVIFVVSLSCYDELTFEDDSNAMTVSVSVFAENVNSSWFTEVPFILFLNKSDLFDEKIKSVPIKAASVFSGYDGADNDRDASLDYIKGVFAGKNDNANRSVFTHVTNATDKGQIEKVFNDVQTMIINWSLERAGLT